MDENYWMLQAMHEAAKAGWGAHPNPMVGAIIVRDNVELGRGYHHGAGCRHAEIEALRDAASRGFDDVSGADIYVTLEPCNHYGRTPPCTEALIKAGIARCFVGTLDTDHRVQGAGIARLHQAGIECKIGVCERELTRLNAAFFTRTRFNRPYITAKWAMTADGFTATKTASSQWITGLEARQDVHRQRALHDGIMAATNTILCDNPQLNVRLDAPARQPVRVILDRRLRIPKDFNIYQTDNQKTVIFTAQKNIDTNDEISRHVDIYTADEYDGRLDLLQIFNILVNKYQMTTLYCEGGSILHGALHDLHVIDAVHIYIAPKIIGGVGAHPCIAGQGVDLMKDADNFVFEDTVRLGNDIRLTGRFDNLS